jgi:integral membrane protein (TIGR01906 family)
MKANRILAILFVVLMPVVLLLTSVQIVAYDRDYYRDEYIKYGIPEYIGMDMNELMSSTEQLLLYLEGKRDNLDFKASFRSGEEEFFSQRDKQHMVDVKGLFVKGKLIRDLSFLYIIVFMVLHFRKKDYISQLRSLAGYGKWIAAAGTIPVIILIILMNLDFYKYFTIFHEIFFTNDLWLLNPASDRLVNILPEELFTDMAFRISYLYIAGMAEILIGSLLLLKFTGRKHNK